MMVLQYIYLSLFISRAAGKLETEASWMRNFVQTHPKYNHDSIVNDDIAIDLMNACNEIGTGIRPCPEILGRASINRYIRVKYLPRSITALSIGFARKMHTAVRWLAAFTVWRGRSLFDT